MKKIARFLGTISGLTGFILTCYFYDWKLALFIFLMIMGNNLEQGNKEKI
jgi:hypothetical protein